MLINTVTPKELSINPYDLLTNVIVYYPMQWDMHDEWPNGWDLSTVTGSYTGGTNYNTLSAFKGRNSSATYSTSASATIGVWLNDTNSTDWNTLSLWSDGASWWGMVQSKRSLAIVIGGSSYGTTTIAAQTWFHFLTWVFDYTNRTLKFYLDGELKQTNSNLPSSWWLRWWSWIQLWSAASWTSGNTTGQYWITFATQNAMSQADIQAFYNASKNLYV